MLKLDKLPFGIVIGALAPILGLVIYYYLKAPSISFTEFVEYFFKTKAMLTAVGSLSLIVNIVLFTIFINGRRDKTAIGIFVMTLMYGLMILYAKFFM
jgi:hypothetical protein